MHCAGGISLGAVKPFSMRGLTTAVQPAKAAAPAAAAAGAEGAKADKYAGVKKMLKVQRHKAPWGDGGGAVVSAGQRCPSHSDAIV